MRQEREQPVGPGRDARGVGRLRLRRGTLHGRVRVGGDWRQCSGHEASSGWQDATAARLTASACRQRAHLNAIGLARGVLDLGPVLARPASFTAVGHRHVVQVVGHLVAVLVGPVEELQRVGGLRRLVLRLVHQDEGGAGDRPGVLAGLLGQDLVEALAPVGTRGGGLEGCRRRATRNCRPCSSSGHRPSCSAWRRRTRRSRSSWAGAARRRPRPRCPCRRRPSASSRPCPRPPWPSTRR